MKLRDLNESIAQTCDVRSNVVSAVQLETFRQMRTALEKGEKVLIPEFGIFVSREVKDKDGTTKHIIRFREKSGETRKEKRQKKVASTAKLGAPLPAGEGGDEE